MGIFSKIFKATVQTAIAPVNIVVAATEKAVEEVEEIVNTLADPK